MDVLKYRSKGESVKKLQRMLNLDGHGLIVDGDFGIGTRSAVRKFQSKYKLIVDGVVGRQSWLKLSEIEQRPYRITKHDRQTVYVSFNKTKVKEIDILNSKGAFETVQGMYRRLMPKPTLIFNGGLYDTRTGTTLSKVIDEGKKITNGYYSQFGVYVDKNGIIKFGYEEPGTKEFMGASPTLVIDDKINIDKKGLDNGFLNNRHPRTLFAESKDEYHIVMVHGRRSWLSHRGMTINEAASFCLNILDSVNAINLDGGGSCMLVDEFGKPINLPLEYRAIDNAVCVYL